MVDEAVIWSDVPEPQQQIAFLVEEVKDFEFCVITEEVVAGFDVADMIYLVGGVWRVLIDDQDEDEEVTSAIYRVFVDHRFNPEEVRLAVLKLMENLYAHDEGATEPSEDA